MKSGFGRNFSMFNFFQGWNFISFKCPEKHVKKFSARSDHFFGYMKSEKFLCSTFFKGKFLFFFKSTETVEKSFLAWFGHFSDFRIWSQSQCTYKSRTLNWIANITHVWTGLLIGSVVQWSALRPCQREV